jgi:PTS system nitrogen regulatory IIA component
VPDLLSLKQLAEYLQLSQRTVYRLLERGDLPAVKVGGQWRFRRSTVDEWLDVNMQRLDAASLHALDDDRSDVASRGRLSDLITPENAAIQVTGATRDEIVHAFVGAVRFPEAISVDLVTERVLERERLCSTAVADGVAILQTPRSRPRVLTEHDLVAIGRVAQAVDFGALDGSGTDTLVLLLARSERDQLALLAKIARLSREPGFLRTLHDAQGPSETIALIRLTEDRVFAPAT